MASLPRSRFLDVTQCSPKRKKVSFGGALRDIQKTAARETTTWLPRLWFQTKHIP